MHVCWRLAVLAAIVWRAAAGAAPAPAAPPAARGELLDGINALRAAAGVGGVDELPALERVAQQRAEEIGARGELPGEAESMTLFGVIQRRLATAGYRAHLWTESIAAAGGDAAAVLAWWQTTPDLAAAMRREFRDCGIGVARFRGVPLYVFLFAWREPDAWEQEAAPLRDLARVRTALLAAVNAARRGAALPPLAADPRLDAAAQAHAADMLARSYYSHETPEGRTPRRRIEATGCNAPLVAENIAARHLSVERAMAGWMASADHRRNILDPRLTHLGGGVVVGTYDHRYQILWVMDLARLEP